MTNGIDIKDKQSFAELYAENQGLAIGILFENVAEIKKHCACRYEQCKAERKSARVKNITIQAFSGVVGGAAAAWAWLTKMGS